MPTGCFVAKWALRTTIIRSEYETLGLDVADMVVERGGIVGRGLAATADTICDSLA